MQSRSIRYLTSLTFVVVTAAVWTPREALAQSDAEALRAAGFTTDEEPSE
ncbi:MAG: hypothetical protein WD205_02605 [Rhodothermales bacterium]